MKKQDLNKKELTLGLISLIFIVGTFLWGLNNKTLKDECLANSEKYIIGEVSEIYYHKGKNVKIYFGADGKRYLANQKTYDASDPVYVGDRFYVHYCEDDPSLNRILFDRRVKK